MRWSVMGKMQMVLVRLIVAFSLTTPWVAGTTVMVAASSDASPNTGGALAATSSPTPGPAGLDDTPEPPPPTPKPNPHSAAVMFIENVGQFPTPNVQSSNTPASPSFQVTGAGGTIYLAPDAVWITLLDFRPTVTATATATAATTQPATATSTATHTATAAASSTRSATVNASATATATQAASSHATAQPNGLGQRYSQPVCSDYDSHLDRQRNRRPDNDHNPQPNTHAQPCSSRERYRDQQCNARFSRTDRSCT